MADLELGQVVGDNNYNFKTKYDEDKDIYTDNLHSCEYYEIPELKKKFLEYKECFSTYSHNIRSINGHWDDLLIIFSCPILIFASLSFYSLQTTATVFNEYV